MPISRITENTMVTRDGTVRKIDALMCVTGFDVFQKDSVPTLK
ncbi:MAG: hypothetical protein AB9Q22_14320 [Candidatus Reddybacter sp.]